MKKIISLIVLFVVLGFTSTVMLSSDVRLILRALYQPEETDWKTMMMPSWLADFKLKTLGVKSCTLSLAEKNDSGAVINFLVSAYGGGGVDNVRVETYITRFVAQGCSINEYDMAGMTPLHAAVLFAQPKLVSILIDNDADVAKKISRSDKRFNGMSPLKFANYLQVSNDSQELRAIIKTLQAKE